MKTKVLQFGEGSFLRCFIDWMIQRMNDRAGFDGAVQIVQPRTADFTVPSKILNARNGRYHVCLRGLVDGQTVEELEEITCVRGVDLPTRVEQHALEPDVRFVVSNTTEAGIQYVPGVDTFPAKVARLVTARCRAGLPGLVFLPCELIARNGEKLKDCTRRYIDDPKILRWLDDECVFCSTLVDRIVSGRPDPASVERYAERLGERDDALVCGEPFHFLAIEQPAGFDLEAEFPLARAGINVVYAPDLEPYRMRKIRFLNAVHTTLVHLALEKGFTEVAQCCADPEMNRFLRRLMFDEIFPTVDLPDEEKTAFAESVLERFANPFAHHRLESIALNTAAKWKARCLPVVVDYCRIFGKLPDCLMMGYDAMARHFDAASGNAK